MLRSWSWWRGRKHRTSRRGCLGLGRREHLKAEQRQLLTTWQLEELVRKYSDYVHFPIELRMQHEKADTPPEYRTINQGAPLWQRSPSDVTEEQYDELYRHLTHGICYNNPVLLHPLLNTRGKCIKL